MMRPTCVVVLLVCVLLRSSQASSAGSPLLQEIEALTKKMNSPFGGWWRYAKVSAPLNVRVPVITGDGGVLWNYLGQSAPPTQVKVTASEYEKLLRVTLLAIEQLSVAAGVAMAQEGYEGMNAALNASYYESVGVEYNGTLWDYFEGRHPSEERGPSLDWIPYASIVPATNAKPNTPTLNAFLTEIGLLHPTTESTDLSAGTSVKVCKSRLPPSGCRVDGDDSLLDVADCLLWPESAAIIPEPCGALGFLADDGQGVCANVAGSCAASGGLYQELYSVWGETVYCCRCTGRRPDDPLPGGTCPSSWKVGEEDCYGLATGACKGAGGLFSTTFDPKCCMCEGPPARRLSPWDDFKAWVDASCLVAFPGARELGPPVSPQKKAMARAIGAYMNGLAKQSCYDRAAELEGVLYRDPSCTQKYTTTRNIQAACMVESHHCGKPGHPIRARLPGPSPETPMTYYLKDGSSCEAHQWDENYGGTLQWCG